MPVTVAMCCSEKGRWVYRLEHKAEGLRSTMQVVNHPRAVSGLVGRCARVYVFHPVLHGIVEQHCDLAHGAGSPTRSTVLLPSHERTHATERAPGCPGAYVEHCMVARGYRM
jgi:hypothetical protein